MQLMWFRNDLRSVENLAFQEALQRDPNTCALYIHCPAQMKTHDVGVNRQLFHLEYVKLLFEEIQSHGIPCIYGEVDHFSDISQFLIKLVCEQSIESIWFNREYGCWELERDESVRLSMAELGVSVHSFDDGMILPAHAVVQKSGQPYKVFTPFRNKWHLIAEETYFPRFNSLLLPSTIQKGQQLLLGQKQGSELLQTRITLLSQQVSQTVKKTWPVYTGVATQRVEQFMLDHLSEYDQHRNAPSIQGTSQLSAYIASGVLSVRQLYQTAKAAPESSGRHIWVSELIWRDFYRQIMIHFPHVSRGKPFNKDYMSLEWLQNPTHLEAWKTGHTGVPLVDAGMRQLLQTGWMHNRVRMVVAMFLSKNLFLDWKYGERYFMQHLVDGDFASNNGGWQWSASVGTDAAPYFRVFNPLTQSERFDGQAKYIKRYVPELQHAEVKWILRADKYQKELVKVGYVPLIVNIKQTRLNAIEAFKRFKAQ